MQTSLWLGRRGRPPEPWQHASVDRVPYASYEVVIVGGGLTGLATAVHLAREGVRPLVLEARWLGAGTTGHSTAKLSLLQGAVVSGIRHHFGADVTRAYVTGNRIGQDWLLSFLDHVGVPVQRRDAYTYAVTEQGARAVAREYAACREAGLPVEHAGETELPFRTLAAIRLVDQAQFDPTDVLVALRNELLERGGSVVEGVRVTGVSSGSPLVVTTTQGQVEARYLVLATGIPILDRGLYFAKLKPHRSYALAYRVSEGAAAIPQGMYLSVDDPGRSLRTAPHEHDELLLVGGNSHPVGRHPSPRSLVQDLDAWTVSTFPGAQLLYQWSAQDYESADRVPLVGPMPGTRGTILVATGYHKWGMSNAVAAASMLTADILGRELAWARPLRHRGTGARDVASGVQFNAAVAARMTGDYARTATAALPGAPRARPAEGQGRIDGRALPPAAVSTVEGCTRRVDAVCPHLRGILAWNDAESTWDCPLHGSRFTADGHLLEGPATRGLSSR